MEHVDILPDRRDVRTIVAILNDGRTPHPATMMIVLVLMGSSKGGKACEAGEDEIGAHGVVFKGEEAGTRWAGGMSEIEMAGLR